MSLKSHGKSHEGSGQEDEIYALKNYESDEPIKASYLNPNGGKNAKLEHG